MTPHQAGSILTSMAARNEQAEDWGALSQLPGNPMMWILILSELLVFGVFFAAFAFARTLDPSGFDADQAQLDRLLGGINTMVLVTSGFLAAVAVRLRSEERRRGARAAMVGAIGVGSIFLVVKLIEYGEKAQAGIGIESSTFFTLYYLMTGFHFMHVVLGLVILGIVVWKDSLTNLETGAAFWHMVDLIWVLMFPLVYLIR